MKYAPRKVIENRLIFFGPYEVLMFLLGISKASIGGDSASDVWLAMTTAIFTYAIATWIMKKFLVEENGGVRINFFLMNRENVKPLAERITYVWYAYAILIGGAVSTIIVEFFEFFIHLEFIYSAPSAVFIADTFAAYSVLYAFSLEYGSQKTPQPDTSQKNATTTGPLPK